MFSSVPEFSFNPLHSVSRLLLTSSLSIFSRVFRLLERFQHSHAKFLSLTPFSAAPPHFFCSLPRWFLLISLSCCLLSSGHVSLSAREHAGKVIRTLRDLTRCYLFPRRFESSGTWGGSAPDAGWQGSPRSLRPSVWEKLLRLHYCSSQAAPWGPNLERGRSARQWSVTWAPLAVTHTTRSLFDSSLVREQPRRQPGDFSLCLVLPLVPSNSLACSSSVFGELRSESPR